MFRAPTFKNRKQRSPSSGKPSINPNQKLNLAYLFPENLEDFRVIFDIIEFELLPRISVGNMCKDPLEEKRFREGV